MAELIVIDPMTRISGFLEIRAEVDQNVITSVLSQGLLYRGFEAMLKGRSPMDAVFFTERICGICSAAHSFASTLAVEEALQIDATQNDKYLRELMHGFEFIQNHLRHFYIMTLPSYVKITSPPIANVDQYEDFRLPEEASQRLEKHYASGYSYAMLAHEGQAVLGGKAPHNHGIFVGGVTTEITAYKVEKVKSIINTLLSEAVPAMLEDIETIAYYYPDYFEMGMSYTNFMSYGVFSHDEPDLTYVNPGILADGLYYNFEPEKITEQVKYAWFQNDQNMEQVDLEKKDAYTFIKAPRYNGMPMEVGPLARMLISGGYSRGHSCMDRIYARVLEVDKILNIMKNMIDRITLEGNGQRVLIMPDRAEGAGLIDTTRGALGHWLSIQNKVIDHYNIITPSNWNISPMDDNGIPGVIEKALIGTYINDIRSPVEIGRIVRSFDPCVSCATHLLGRNGCKSVIEVRV